MADETYYAWTRIPVDRNEWGQVTKEVQPGERVTAKDLKVGDQEFEELVNAGAIRTAEYPSDEFTAPANVPVEEVVEEASVKELRLTPQQGVNKPQQQQPADGNKGDISAQLANKS